MRLGKYPLALSILVILVLIVIFVVTLPEKEIETPDISEDFKSYYLGKTEKEVLRDALRSIKMDLNDLWLKSDVVEDDFRLSVVERVMNDPYEGNLKTLLEISKEISSEEMWRVLKSMGERLDTSPERFSVEGKGISALVYSMAVSEELISEAFSNLTEEELAILDKGIAFLLEGAEPEVEEEEFLRIVRKVERDRLYSAGVTIVSTMEENLDEIREEADTKENNRISTPIGYVVIGTKGDDEYLLGEGVIGVIDPGGNDLYKWMESSGITFVIDFSGNDTYIGEDFSLGGARFGISILYDLSGNDYYKGENFSIGSSYFGVGVLRDFSGNDYYEGDTCTQGAGVFGLGVLRDHSGNDTYRAAFESQAFGFTWGFGVLHDLSGNDLYYAGGKYLDYLRFKDRYLSLSQGFGFGMRPYASGGIGFLRDDSGNDVYFSDVFGQASSYWFSLGYIHDLSGNDVYQGWLYNQGAATHLCGSLLLEEKGNDSYYAKGVSQGCGHDLAIGMLIDREGNDSYIAADLSQGAGNANGIGILIDNSGNDSYTVTEAFGVYDNAQGYGNWRRDFGSIGILIDLSGDDKYSEPGRTNNRFYRGTNYGVVLDVETKEGGARD